MRALAFALALLSQQHSDPKAHSRRVAASGAGSDEDHITTTGISLRKAENALLLKKHTAFEAERDGWVRPPPKPLGFYS